MCVRVQVAVYDKDMVTSDLLGEATIHLKVMSYLFKASKLHSLYLSVLLITAGCVCVRAMV